MRGKTRLQTMELPIGVLSERARVKIETIRYYERIGLLPPPRRSEGGHRLYDDGLARRLQFVRRSRELGFSIEDIRALLRLVDQGGLNCADAKGLIVNHLAEIRDKIFDLKKLERVLVGMAKACDGNQLRSCPVLETLSKAV